MGRQYDIPTIVTSCLAVAMTICYFIVPDNGKQIFIVFTAISWFIVAVCWLALKSTQYMHNLGGHEHDEKKKLATNSGRQHTVQISSSELSHAKAELSADLDDLQSTLKNKDTEIENLKAEIASLHTLVEIEKLRTDLANLKALAAKESAKKK
ncbi:MAG: hypothetical protein KGH99_00530 [Thaumarchaeota archaeon]|nr:hypothetical protein [Nitrososphaerota archaeon]MDE1871946.1 hypothetical protein [Nitrososphaerota archaeon]